MRNLRFLAALLAMIAAGGCASLLAPPDAGFGEVSETVNRRIRHQIRWDREMDRSGELPPEARAMLDDGLTADEAVRLTLLNNRRLQATYEELGVARAELIQAALLANPVFDVSVKIHSEKEVIEFAAVQDLLGAFLIPLRRARAKAGLEMAKGRVASEVIHVAGKAHLAFYRLLAAQRSLRTERTILEAASISYEAARRLHEAGNITDLALALEQSLYEQARVAVSAAESAAAAEREAMNRLMSLYGPDADWEALGELPPPPEEELDLGDVERRAVSESLDLAAAKARVDAAAQQLGIERVKSVIPELGGGAEGEREPDRTWFVGPLLEFALPVFDWGQGSRRRAEAELRRAWKEYTALAIDVRSVARSARNRLVAARQRAEHHRRVLLPLRERLTRETHLEFNAMQVGVFQLLAAKRRETVARRQYAAALREYWMARIELSQILHGRFLEPTGGVAGASMSAMPGEGGH